jgi:hypothetical protein
MTTADRASALKELQRIPGVGKAVAADLWELGVRSPGDLKGQSPEELYRRLCEQAGAPIDRCMLYVFRCAVYYASHETHDPELLKWWNWKNPAPL